MVGRGLEEGLREGILHIGPVDFLVAAVLAEDELGGEPAVVDVFVVEDDDAFPITIIYRPQHSLKSLLFLFFSLPSRNPENISPYLQPPPLIPKVHRTKGEKGGEWDTQFMPRIQPKHVRTILFIKQIQTNSYIPGITLFISIINRKNRARIPNSNTWLAAVTAHIWILASSRGEGSVRGIISVWSGWGALICPVRDTF